MRPTTKRRVIILAASAVLGSLALGGVYEFRQYQINAKTTAYRDEGMAAFKQGDFARALIPLSKYNERRQNDAETLFAFGKARSRVEAPGNRHLGEAIQYFRRGLEVQPDNMEAKHTLLGLYFDVGYNAEAIALADELLQKDPKDVGALRTKAKALTMRRQFNDAFATASKLNELAPDDVEGQRLTFFLMSAPCLNRPASEIRARAEKNNKDHPNDPRFVMLDGYAYHCILDNDTAKKRYEAATAAPPTDPAFVQICTEMMDEIGMFDGSEELLKNASKGSHDPRMLRMLIQRLWQNGRYPEVVERLKNLDPSTTASDSHLLAYRAYALYQLQKDGEAKPIVDALAARKDDDVALAWGKALSARFGSPNPNPRDQVQQYQAALIRDPGNAAIRYMMGEAYANLGETELAIDAWSTVIRALPSWPTPRVQLAYLLAATGRSETAAKQAAVAWAASNNLASAIGFAVAKATQLDATPNKVNVAELINLTDKIQQAHPGEPQTLPIHVSLLARTGDKDKAVATVRDAIAKAYPLGTDGWLRLASVSRAQHLGLEKDILDQAEKAYGFSPRLALARAFLLSESGKPQDGLTYLTSAAAKATTTPAMWKASIAQYLEHIRDPNNAHDTRAHDAWVEVGDQFPDDLTVQSAVVDLPDGSSAWADRPFIDRTIQRLRSLTSDQGYHWQLARSRWLLTSGSKKDTADAVVTLSEIVRGSPGLAVPRLYLAKALEMGGNTAAAIEQLRTAAEMSPENTAVALDLVRLYQADGKYDDAKAYLDRAAESAPDERSRRRVAAAYARQGDTNAAINTLTHGKGADTVVDSDPAAGAILAELYRRKGDFEQTTKVYQKLVAAPAPDASTLAAAADYFASHGKTDQAIAALDGLSKVQLPAGHREAIRADYTEKHGSKADAERLYHQAINANPTDPKLWLQLAAFQLRQNQFEQAAATCDAALVKIPKDEELTQLRNQALALRTNNGAVDTEALVAELSKDPRNAAARDSLAAYNESRKNNDPPDRAAQKMRRVADQYPLFLPVQMQVARMYMQAGKATEAIVVANRAMDNFPNDAEPAGLMTVVYAGAGRWNDALHAAEEWRRRSLENPLQPDLAIAKASLELGQAAKAMQVLQPYLDAAKRDPDKHNSVIGTYAQALVASSREPEAAALLAPYLPRSDDWRVPALRLSTLVHGADATAKWIEQVAATVPSDSVRGQYEVANAWYLNGLRFQQAGYFTRARDVIVPLAKRPDAKAGILMMAGSISEQAKDPDGAIDAYRRALQLDPKQPLAQNNLAYLLLTKGIDLDEARQLAEKAVAASPTEANYYDTLARVYAKAGKRDQAIASFQKVLDLDPNNVQAMVPTIRLLREEGQRDAARAMMAKLETILQSNPSLATPDVDVQSLRQQL